ALLKIIEGSVASVPPQGGRKHPHQDFIQINTTNILFIVGGAFEGLDKIIDRRLGKNRRNIGFHTTSELALAVRQKDIDALLREVTHDDLLQYGLIPEFVGRLPMMVALESLDRNAMIRILTEPKNVLVKQFRRFFALDGVELSFTPEALEACAQEAIAQKTGARGLRTVLEDTLMEVMYEIPSRGDVKKCVVSAESITNRQRPLLLTRAGQTIDYDTNSQRVESA
ncbi:MAG: AAA family ATPase, partial [Dehalococcoidia bacterium]